MADIDPGKRRQAIIGVILVAVIGFMLWQVFGLFGGSKPSAPKKTAATRAVQAPMPTPKAAELPAAAPLSPREIQMMQAQQALEAQYLAAINELQMLKIQREIADANKAIASAKLATVNSQKSIVSLLAPEQSNNYAQRLTNTAQGVPVGQSGAPTNIIETKYTVISVSEIQGRWSAVLGAQGKLYNVHVGDVLPADSSKVVSIDRGGVVLEKDGMKKTVSLVPVI